MAPIPTGKDFPTIVCLCGSTRFWKNFQEASLQETLAGKIVLSVGAAVASDDEHFGHLSPEEQRQIKERLDELHLRKIDLADEVLILNLGGYIGESTGRELAYAKAHGKRVRFLEPQPGEKETDPLKRSPCKTCGTPLFPNEEKWWGADGPYCPEHMLEVQEEFVRSQAKSGSLN